MQVALERSWLEPAWQMFVGVQSTLKAEEIVRLLTKSGQLDMKIGSADRVDFIFEKGLQGLEFKPADRVPRDLPGTAGLTFFQINRDSRKEEWLNIQKSLTLAIRFNQNRVVSPTPGSLQGQTVLTLRPVTGTSATTTLQFYLFLVPQQA
jgi:type VI secretion system protein ImpJ